VVRLALKALLFSLSITKRSGLLVNGRKSDGYMQFDPEKGIGLKYSDFPIKPCILSELIISILRVSTTV
jgi:hypothetical protein